MPRRPAQRSDDDFLLAVSPRAARTVTRRRQLSDTHIRKPGKLAEGVSTLRAALARAVVAVNALPQPVDAVIVSGDLVGQAKPAQ